MRLFFPRSATRVTVALATALMGCSLIGAASAAVTDLSQWSRVEDPAHPGMSAQVDAMLPQTPATLIATGAIPSAVDIGYASVDGTSSADATNGYVFDPASDFSLAIDFDFSVSGVTVGGGGIGFGIGENVDGTNSAGIGMAFVNGAPLLFAPAARVNDVTESTLAFATPGFASGRFFVSYDSLAESVTVGISSTPGALAATESTTLTGIVDQWQGEPLLASFFLRSQSLGPIPALTSGTHTTVFGNLEVLQGTPIAVPEPATFGVVLLVLAGHAGRRKRSDRMA